MKHSRKTLFVTILIGISVLSACGNSPADSEKELSNNDRLDEDQHSIENEYNEDTNEQNTGGNTRDGNDAINQSDENATEFSNAENELATSNIDLYLQKLNDTKKEVDEWEATDSSTYALKALENKRWETWDDLLNELYGVLQKELSEEEMKALRDEQRKWIEYRDHTALEASEEFKGGTQEHLEYVAVLANLTEERCYELVEDYM